MKILFVGVLDIDWSTNCSMKHALVDLGHTVVDFNYRTIADKYNRNKINNKLLGKWVGKSASFLRSDKVPLQLSWYFKRNGRKEMNESLMELVRKNKFDLVFLSKTDSVDYHLLTEINSYSPTWYFFMDPMDQARRINAKAYAVRATYASATFSDVTEYFKNAGTRAYWLTQGVDTNIFKPKQTRKIYDVVFAGTKTKKRSAYVNSLRKAGFSVTCFGQGWENDPIYQEELTDVYRKSRIVLNFCRPGAGFSIRVFQAMSAGAFLLTEYCPDLERFFKKGLHLDWYQGRKEMTNKIQDYLNNKEKRNHVAAEGRYLVSKKHSWFSVMKNIIDIVNPRFPEKQYKHSQQMNRINSTITL